MNDQWTELQETLEQATAPRDAPPRDLGPDAQSLREAWLAFGRLLEAIESRDSVPLLLASSARQDRRSLLGASQAVAHAGKKRGLVAAALAASLLIGVSVYWMSVRGSAPSSVGPRADQTASTKGVKSAASAAPQRVAAATAADLKWDDSFDEQIAAAGQEVALAQSDLAHAFDASDFVRLQLYQTQQDIEKNKL